MPADVDREWFRQAELVRKPRPKESPDKAKGDGDQAPAVSPSRNSSANGAAYSGDNQEKYEPW